MTKTEGSLSQQGQYHRSTNKKYEPVVLLVPFFGAERTNLRRHIEFLNELGFDCVSFDLNDSWTHLHKNLMNVRLQFGLKHTWADQIEMLLNEIPGPKIIFAFSNPTASAIEAIARRHGAEVLGLICDSGPSGQLLKSILSYFNTVYPIGFFPARLLVSAFTTAAIHPFFLKAIREDLATFPKGFPILSIRGWKDPLIPPNLIDRIFNDQNHLEWQKLSLPKAEHLNGLKDFPDEYKPPVERFLKSLCAN